MRRGVIMEKFVTLSTGVRLSYVEQGAPDGAPMIFLHGVTDSWRSFERLLPLLPRSIHAFALSQRGHGDSSRPALGYRFADMSEDLRAFMDDRGLRTATIVGHSMGGSVAQRFVIDHPERTSALVLMAAFATFQDPGLRDFITSSILPLTDPIGAAFAREWQLSTTARPVDPGYFDTIVAETLKVPAFVWHATFQGFLATEDFTSALANVSVPTLLAWGDRDTYTLRAAQDRLLQAIPGARLIVYEDYGHAFHWEDPARFAADLVAFVALRSKRTSTDGVRE
jgi:pimeloyl-ACP methyl ester carboxylesterase